MRSKAVLFVGINEVRVGEVEIPAAERNERFVTTEFTAVSPGTEGRCLKGDQPNSPDWPYIPGYALIGTDESGERLFSNGTRRASVELLWGGHVAHAVRSNEEWIAVPDGLPSEHAVLAKLCAIAYRGVRMARPLPHETVAVFGLGPVGQLAARLHGATGARVIAFDPLENRRAIFKGESAHPDSAKDLLPNGADVVVDATGHVAVTSTAARSLRSHPWGSDAPRPRFVVQGSYATDMTIDYHSFFIAETEVLFPRDSTLADASAMMNLMTRGLLDVTNLAPVRSADEAPDVYRELAAGTTPGAVFRW